MTRRLSAAPVRRLTKAQVLSASTHRLVAQSTRSNAIGSTFQLGAANIRRSQVYKYLGRWSLSLSYVSHRNGLTNSPLGVGWYVSSSWRERRRELTDGSLVLYACPLPEEDHKHGYEDGLRRVRGTGGSPK